MCIRDRHCSGLERSKNVGTYFIDLYLCGLAAGGVTKTNSIGYVAAHPISEVIRHINAFTIGVREVNPNAKVYVIWIHDWYNPPKARDAAETLMSPPYNCDVLAFTEDSPTVLEVAQEKGGYSFSHYSDMSEYGPDAHLTGQIVNWGVQYEEILSQIRAGIWTPKEWWWTMDDPEPSDQISVPRAADIILPVSEKVPEGVRNLILERRQQMIDPDIPFSPFTGPIRDQAGNVRIPAGKRATHHDLLYMDYFVEGVVGLSLIHI